MTPYYSLLMVPREGGNSTLIFMVEMIVIFAIFYFILIRPQAKERKRHEEALRNIKKGDEIVTNGGIIATVLHLEENRLTVKSGDNTRLTVDRSRVAQVLSDKGGKAE
ncbi:MAG: preprotein translocase subunit YajC [Longimicrobiales bacterium]